MPDWTKNHSLG